MKIKIKAKVKRDATLYVRIRPDNKELVESLAQQMGISASQLVDHILDEVRKQNALVNHSDKEKN